MKKSLPPLIVCLFAVDVLLVLLYIFNFIIGEPFRLFTKFLDINDEQNLPTWFSSIQLFLTAILFGIFGYGKFKSGDKDSWVLISLPVVFVILSIDEVVQVHEYLGGVVDRVLYFKRHGMFNATGLWMLVIGIPVLLLLLFLGTKLSIYLKDRPDVLRRYMVGVLIFLGSALGIEFFTNFTVSKTARVIQASFEELGEMVGVTFIVWASWDLLRSHNFRLVITDPAKTKAAD